MCVSYIRFCLCYNDWWSCLTSLYGCCLHWHGMEGSCGPLSFKSSCEALASTTARLFFTEQIEGPCRISHWATHSLPQLSPRLICFYRNRLCGNRLNQHSFSSSFSWLWKTLRSQLFVYSQKQCILQISALQLDNKQCVHVVSCRFASHCAMVLEFYKLFL